MRRTTRTFLTLALLGALLAGGIGLAQMRGRSQLAAVPRVHAPAAGSGWAGVPRLAGLVLGTTVEVRLYDREPAEGAVARTTLTLTVGEDSEAAFAQALTAARAEAAEWDAAYLVVAVSEQTRSIELPAEDAVAARGARAFVLRLRGAGMQAVGPQADGAITVALYDGDPADGGTLLETLSFTHGVDSAIGFRAALDEALVAATHAVVTTSPRTNTIDLKAAEARVADVAAARAALAERMRARWGDDGSTFERFGPRDLPRGRGMPGRR